MKTRSELNEIATIIVDAMFSVHTEMGAGLLESVYELCLITELKDRGLKVESQKSIPLLYKGVAISKDFKIDVLVEDDIVIEIKSVTTLMPVHKAQILTYLKLANKRLGFLVNFNVPLIKQGIQRIVNGF